MSAQDVPIHDDPVSMALDAIQRALFEARIHVKADSKSDDPGRDGAMATLDLIDEARSGIALLRGFVSRPVDDDDPVDPAIEQAARAICIHHGHDPDEMVMHPASKSWEAPSVPKWRTMGDWLEEIRITAASVRGADTVQAG